MRCMIVDDQSQSTELLTDHVSKIPLMDLKFATTNPVEALTFLDREMVDCIFLDVEMPIVNGLEFMEAIKSRMGRNIPRIVLITAYDRYALVGYDYGVFDYLLKPISFKRFKICADRLLAEAPQPEPQRTFLFVDVEGKKLRINYKDIIYVEGAGNYIFIVTLEKKVIYYRTLTGLLELLPASEFVRVHKSFIVSLTNIKAIKGNEVLVNVGSSQKNIPIGTTYKEHLLKLLRIS